MSMENASRTNSSCGESNSSDEIDEIIEDVNEGSPLCLFCCHRFKNIESAIEHCISDHNFNLYNLKDKFDMDHYGYIRFINYIRAIKPNPTELDSASLWANDKYLRPVDINDPWLWYDLEGLRSGTLDDQSPSKYVNSENGNVTMTQEHFAEMQATIQHLSEEAKEKDKKIVRLMDLFTGGEDNYARTSSDLDSNEDQCYFSSYANSHIHWEMLNDKVRTYAYKDAISLNKPLFAARTVMDLGCGTAILSMFAVSGGASKVFAIDESEIVYHAMDIIRQNSMDKTVIAIKGKIEQVHLPVEKVDILISEWMGYFLLFEGMLDSVIFARDKYLKPGGLILPSVCNIFIVGANNIERHASAVDFWDNVYSYNMKCMKSLTIREASVELVDADHIITSTAQVHSIDIATCSTHDAAFTSDFILTGLKDGLITHLVGYFDVIFNLPNMISFTTGPSGTPTHWKQTIFIIHEPVFIEAGQSLTGTITCARHHKEVRSLEIKITLNGVSMEYCLT